MPPPQRIQANEAPLYRNAFAFCGLPVGRGLLAFAVAQAIAFATMRAATAAAANSLSDVELASRVAQGDQEVFRQLVRRHSRMLWRAVHSILKNDAEAEDALQDAYLRAFRAIAGFRGEAKLSTWLVRIVVNERAAQCAQTLDLLETKIDLLPDALRTVFRLRALQELSTAERAAVLDLPGATVRTRFFRARSRLRQALSNDKPVPARNVTHGGFI